MPQHLAEKEQAIASHVCWPKHTHTYTRTHAKNITPQPALLWLWQNSNCQQGSSFSHLASEKLRYPKQRLSPCGKAKNRMHLDIRSKQRSIPTLKCSFECTFHKTSLKNTKMPQLICADTRRHTDAHRHAHTNAHCTKHTIHSILRHVAEIKHADASQWYSKTHTHTIYFAKTIFHQSLTSKGYPPPVPAEALCA